MTLTQENRMLNINTPLGPNEVLLTGISGAEGISEPFTFDLTLISERNNINYEDIIGQNVTVSILLPSDNRRFFNGIISRFSQQRSGEDGEGDLHYALYSATIVPWFWLLTRTSDSRIFQGLSVPEIVEKIFKEKGFNDFRIALGSYEAKDYCVQFRETDFNFVSRLLEQEGIYYFFEHEDGKHTMVLTDSPDGHNPCPHQESARYHQISTGARLDEDVIVSLMKTQEIRIGKYTVNDYNFKTPTADLKVEVNCQIALGPGEREIYDYPAEYSARTEGDRLANIRMQGEEAKITTITGASNCKAFTSGYKFNLTGYYRHEMNDTSYVLVSINHNATEPAGGSDSGSAATYNNNFYCIPFDVPFRPPLVTPKPIGSVQTAVVVGPKGEEIYTDEHGRVKVQFHWDREGKKDENSSCWIRVSQPWAGTGWGAMFIPHIGHEVIVEFVEGDPDRPIITGRVYHGTNMPADKLPEEKTKSVIRSWQDNDIVIEDKDGDKHIHIKQACGNEIIMHEKTPNIEIKQACGNEILMKADGPDIEIKQKCGNEILMHEAEGIQMRDKYGNEVVLDAASKFIHIASPTHNSYLDLGKSLKFGSDSDGQLLVGGERKISITGNTHESFVGTKTALSAAADISSVNGIVVKRYYAYENQVNYKGRHKRTKGPVVADSDTSYHIIGGAGDVSQIILDNAEAKMSYDDSSYVKINHNGIELKTPKKVIIDAQEVQIKTSGDIKMNPTGKVKIPANHWDFGDGDG